MLYMYNNIAVTENSNSFMILLGAKKHSHITNIVDILHPT